MIEGFRHKGLRRFYEDGDASKLSADQTRRIGVLLAALDAAETPEELNRPSFGLHALKGDLKGFWAMSVNGNWRVIFRFEDGAALDVDLVDYH